LFVRRVGAARRIIPTMPAEPVPSTPRPRIIVIGLGNPVLGDDGVGWRVADEVERRLGVDGRTHAGEADGDRTPTVEIDRLDVGGLSLMERITGFDLAILIDAAQIPDRPIGEVRSCPFDELDDRSADHLDSAHDASLRTALELGQRLGAGLPGRIEIVTVQIRSVDEFSDALSPDVATAVPAATVAVMRLLAAAG
jgi:hydrogenase maturation protease